MSFCSQPAHALVVGEIVVDSSLDEPLLAYIPISPESPVEKITLACLSLIKSESSQEQQRLNLSDARLELEGNSNTGQRIKLTTAAPVHSRALSIELKASCVPNGLVIREFYFDLNPTMHPAQRPTENLTGPSDGVAASAVEKLNTQSEWQKPELNGALRVGYFGSSRKLDGNNNLSAGSLWLKARQDFKKDISLVAQGWVRNDDSFKASGSLAKLQEGYLKFSVGQTDYRIGKQIIVWGRADRLNPTDNLTPRNFTLLTPEEDDQRMGSLAAKITYHSLANSLTGIWIHDRNPNVFPVATTPGIIFTEQTSYANQYALKFDRSGSEVDWSASYFTGIDLNPDIAIGATTSSGTNLIFEHNHIRVLGLDAATAIGRYGFRAEAAYTWTANTGVYDFLVKKPFFYMVVGGDRTFFDYLNVNVQYYRHQVANYADPQTIVNPLLRATAIQGAVMSNQLGPVQHGVSVRVSDKWLNETLEGEIAAVSSFERSNYFIRPKLIYAFNDYFKGTLGWDIYRGETNSYFGQLRNSSMWFAEMKYGF